MPLLCVDMGDVDGFLEFDGKLGTCEMLIDAVQLFHGTFHPHLHPTVGRVVGEDGHDDLTLAELFGQFVTLSEEVLQAMPKLFEHGIDEVGTHRVAGVELHPKLIVIGNLVGIVDQLYVKDAASAFLHVGGDGVGVIQKALLDGGEEIL